MNKKTFLKHSLFWVFSTIALIIIFLFLSMTLFSFSEFKDVSWLHMQEALYNNTSKIMIITFLIPILSVAMLSVFYYTIWRKKTTSAKVIRAKSNEYGESDFLANEKTSSNLSRFETVYSKNSNDVGWVVKSKIKDDKSNFWISSCDKSGHHCLVLGATSSGKTQKTILPSISYNASKPDIKNKPSMVVFDPKGEIANLQAEFLRKNGYEVLVFNLRNTFRSACWNPLYLATKTYIEAKLIIAEIKDKMELLNSEIDDLKIEIQNETDEIKINSLKQELNRKQEELDNYIVKQSESIMKLNKTDEIVNDLAIALYKKPESKEKFWEENAKAGFVAIYYLMLEALEHKYINNRAFEEIDLEQLKEEYEKINFPSIATIMSNTKGIQEYYKTVDKLQDIEMQQEFKLKKSFTSGASVFNVSENTLGSTMATINADLNQYKQGDIINITNTNEIKLDELTTGEKPIALFIIAPDEKENTYKFATLLIDQIYKANIELASKQKNQKLPRSLMFYLDEFGNIPTIPKFDTMITVSRSRGIYFCIAVQGFNQIDSKYGKDEAKVIIENMLLHLYVSSTDQDTQKYYQQRAGSYTIYKQSTSENSSMSSSSSGISTNIDKKELLTLEDIKNNPSDMLLVFFQNKEVSWVKTDAYWKCKDLHSKANLDEMLPAVRIFASGDYYFDPLTYWYSYFMKEQEKLKQKAMEEAAKNNNSSSGGNTRFKTQDEKIQEINRRREERAKKEMEKENKKQTDKFSNLRGKTYN